MYLLLLQNGIPKMNGKLPDIHKSILITKMFIQTKYLHKRVLHKRDDGLGLWRHKLCILHKIHVQLLKD